MKKVKSLIGPKKLPNVLVVSIFVRKIHFVRHWTYKVKLSGFSKTPRCSFL